MNHYDVKYLVIRNLSMPRRYLTKLQRDVERDDITVFYETRREYALEFSHECAHAIAREYGMFVLRVSNNPHGSAFKEVELVEDRDTKITVEYPPKQRRANI